MSPENFVLELSSLKFPNVFNPYVDVCSIHDTAVSPSHRKVVLLSVLKKAAAEGIDSLWIGRDLGYKGGRRTGLALTDDVNFTTHVKRWGLDFSRPTTGKPCAERTATVVWELLSAISNPVFLWNVFPLHPHDSQNEFSNRAHNSAERRSGEEILSSLIQMLQPRQIVAIGNDAFVSASRLSGSERDVVRARHPSYGGQTEFVDTIRSTFGIVQKESQKKLF